MWDSLVEMDGRKRGAGPHVQDRRSGDGEKEEKEGEEEKRERGIYSDRKKARERGKRKGRRNHSRMILVMMVVASVAIVLATDYIYGLTWYTSYGLSFGGIYGTPSIDGMMGPETGWHPSLAVEVRMTAILYTTFVMTGIAGALAHVYLIPWLYTRTMITTTTVGAMMTTKRREEEEKGKRSFAAHVAWRRLTHYVVLLALVTSIARAIIHALVVPQLMPSAASRNPNSKVYYFDQLHEISRGAGKEPPVAGYADFTAEPRCNSVLERKTEMCRTRAEEEETASGNAPGTPASSQPVCTSTPCPVGHVIDTNAIGGPLSAFGKVRPVPTFTTALPYADMWRDFYDFPVVFRNTTKVPVLENHVSHDPSQRMEAGSISDAERLFRICKDETQHLDEEEKLTVGYSMDDPKFTYLDNFANLYRVYLNLDEYYNYNVRCSHDVKISPEAALNFTTIERRLVDLELFTGKQELSKTNAAAAPNSMYVNEKVGVVSYDDYIHNTLRGNGLYKELLFAEVEALQKAIVSTNPKYCGRGYVFDVPAVRSCTRLMNSVPFTKYAKDNCESLDISQQLGLVQENAQHKKAWPSWFIGFHGVKSAMHQDGSGTGFFLMIVSGRKVFRVIRVEDAMYFVEKDPRHPDKAGTDIDEESNSPWEIYKRFEMPRQEDDNGDDTGVDTFDIFNPGGGRWRDLASTLTMYETVLEAGDIIYIPRWGLHAATNLVDETISISGNFKHWSLYPFYRDACASQYTRGIADPLCAWTGLVGAGYYESGYGSALYVGFRILSTHVHVHVLGKLMKTFRGLTSGIVDWSKRLRTTMPSLGWQVGYDFDESSPKECFCCCKLDFVGGVKSGERLAWLRPLKADMTTECKMGFFRDLGIADADIQPRMQACFHMVQWQRLSMMIRIAITPASLIFGFSLIMFAWQRAASRSLIRNVKKE